MMAPQLMYPAGTRAEALFFKDFYRAAESRALPRGDTVIVESL